MCKWEHTGAKGQHGVSPAITLCQIFLETVSFTESEPAGSTRLAGQKVPGIFPRALLYPAFYMDAGVLN